MASNLRKIMKSTCLEIFNFCLYLRSDKAELVQPFFISTYSIPIVSIQVESAISTKDSASFWGILCIF